VLKVLGDFKVEEFGSAIGCPLIFYPRSDMSPGQGIAISSNKIWQYSIAQTEISIRLNMSEEERLLFLKFLVRYGEISFDPIELSYINIFEILNGSI
jgi:hypothetical protein